MAENERTEIGDELEAELAEGPAEDDAPAKKQPRKPRKPKGYVRILLEESEEIPPSGLFLSMNGNSYLLQPGVEADVPQGVVDILENAIMSVPRIDPSSKRVVGYKNRLRYPFRKV
jgi:hypothetical protein